MQSILRKRVSGALVVFLSAIVCCWVRPFSRMLRRAPRVGGMLMQRTRMTHPWTSQWLRPISSGAFIGEGTGGISREGYSYNEEDLIDPYRKTLIDTKGPSFGRTEIQPDVSLSFVPWHRIPGVLSLSVVQRPHATPREIEIGIEYLVGSGKKVGLFSDLDMVIRDSQGGYFLKEDEFELQSLGVQTMFMTWLLRQISEFQLSGYQHVDEKITALETIISMLEKREADTKGVSIALERFFKEYLYLLYPEEVANLNELRDALRVLSENITLQKFDFKYQKDYFENLKYQD